VLFGATLLLLGAPRPVNGQQQHAASQVTLTLNEFQDLFSSARLEEAERRLLDQGKMQEAQHKLKLQELEDLKHAVRKEREEQRNRVFPLNYHVLQHTASGYFNSSSSVSGMERDMASFDLELVLRVPSQSWTLIPIVNTSIVTSDWSVSWRNDGEHETFSVVDPMTSPDILLLLREEQQVLATNRSGLFSIKFKAHTRVGKTRNLNTLSLSSLLYSLSSFTLRIANEESSHVRDFGVRPVSALVEVEQSNTHTDLKATLPLFADGIIQVKWLDVGDEKDESTATKPSREAEIPQVTATHEVLHEVGEGMIVKSLHILNLVASSESSSLNNVQFLVNGKGLRVTSVLGHSLQSWSTEDTEDSSKLIRATFKSSHLDSAVTLHVHTEMDGSADNGLVELPHVECKNVLRQVGHIAVVKEANIEVHEDKSVGVLRCEPSEISSQLRSNIDCPIILSYKYLNPENSVVLNVQEHAAMETLEATVDRIHYKALVTNTHTVHSMILIMQSTKLQYLELFSLPSSASMFTVAVNSVPAKPVEGKTSGDSILIPLLVGLDTEVANEGGSMRTSVELNYVSSHDSLGHNGTLQLAPPQLKLPISVLTVHLRLPEKYEYEFGGDFGSKPLKHMEYPLPQTFSYATGKRVVEQDYEFSAIDDNWPEDSDPGKAGAVKIVTPKMGNSFHFQRLLVVDTKTSLDVHYSEKDTVPEKSWLWKLLGQ